MTSAACTEVEIKLKLGGEDNWRRLCAGLAPAATEVLQVNRFFDTPERSLSAARLALRLRQEAELFIVTLKGPKRMRGAATERFELEATLSEAQGRSVLSEPAALLRLDLEPVQALHERVQASSLSEVLRFENLRRRYPRSVAGLALILEVDRTRFPDGDVDYELEVELAPDLAPASLAAVEAELRELLSAEGIPYQLEPEGKFSRALRHQSS